MNGIIKEMLVIGVYIYKNTTNKIMYSAVVDTDNYFRILYSYCAWSIYNYTKINKVDIWNQPITVMKYARSLEYIINIGFNTKLCTA